MESQPSSLFDFAKEIYRWENAELETGVVLEEMQIVPIGKIDTQDLDMVLRIAEASFPAIRTIVGDETTLPSHAFDKERQQYDAQILLEALEGRSCELMTLGSNLVLRDGKLNIQANEWLQPIREGYPALEAEYFRLEPAKMPINKAKTET